MGRIFPIPHFLDNKPQSDLEEESTGRQQRSAGQEAPTSSRISSNIPHVSIGPNAKKTRAAAGLSHSPYRGTKSAP